MEVTLRKWGPVDLDFQAPPSKSYTHRALIAAGLARGDSTLLAPLISDDTEVTRGSLRAMGVDITHHDGRDLVKGTCGCLTCPAGLTLDMRNSGTSMRLFASLALLCEGPVTLTGSPRMNERPLGPLADALGMLGGEVSYLGKEGYPPVTISGSLLGGDAVVDPGISSQFVSSLLMAAPCAEKDVNLFLGPGIVSPSYLDITLDVMRSFGAMVDRDGYHRFHVPAGRGYQGRTYSVEGDYSSASYFFALAAMCGGRVAVSHLSSQSCQGDRRFLAALASMGCKVKGKGDTVEVSSDGDLQGIEIDMSSSPDTVQTLSMVAATAKSPSRITGIGHLKFKESDRLMGTARLLNGLGGDVRVEGDSLVIHPSPLHGGTIDPGDDHRTAMSFAVLGLATGNVKIIHAECVNKSFPGFWERLTGQGLL